MSRIHDAVQKAAEERHGKKNDAVQDFDFAPPPVTSIGDATPIMLTSPIPIDGEAALDALPTGLSSSKQEIVTVVSEQLLSGCVEQDWRPSDRILFSRSTSENQDFVGREQFRKLRSRLYHLRRKQPLKTVMVASATPAEGKSFIAANLAFCLAQQQKCRVLLVDGDMRNSRLQETLGTAPKPGLTDLLSEQAGLESVLTRDRATGLYFISRGGQVGDPAELAANGKLRVVMNALAPVFDWIIVDSAPVVPVSDAVMMAGACDGVILVLDAGTTRVEMARRARQEFRSANLLGVVLNRVKSAGPAYNSYYLSGYGDSAAQKEENRQ